MRTPAAAVASAAFFIVAPGTLTGLGPWLITRWQLPDVGPVWRGVQALGVVFIVVGIVPPIHAFVQFVKAGGTPMPIAPTRRLVVGGFNRYIRNPMYAGLLLVILGQAMLFRSFALLVYAAATWVITASFVRWYEEPTLTRQYGDEYLNYRRNVPAWWPRLRPWTPPVVRA
jgi:protein-S-isoprenylcysteine O-methyltransferase Ste14